MRAFLCSIDDTVWDVVEVSWTKPEAAKSTWDKAALAAANANSKALNAIFCGVSPDEFHRISHITIAKEAWEILETTYEGTKKVKDTKLQMLTTWFEELKMSEDESFDFSPTTTFINNYGTRFERSSAAYRPQTRKLVWRLAAPYK